MLLRNESRVKHIVQIRLVFDDNTKCELEIQEGDYVQISYRKNGCLRQSDGIIRKITPYIHTKKLSCCIKENYESAVITLDMSEEYECRVEKIDILDIIDIKILPTDESCHHCCCCCANKQEVPEEPQPEEPENGEEVVEND